MLLLWQILCQVLSDTEKAGRWNTTNEGSTGLPTQASYPADGAITNVAAKEPKGLTRFSSGSAFPAGQQLGLSGLDPQSRCDLNYTEERKGCVVPENAERQQSTDLTECLPSAG